MVQRYLAEKRMRKSEQGMIEVLDSIVYNSKMLGFKMWQESSQCYVVCAKTLILKMIKSNVKKMQKKHQRDLEKV